MAFILPTFNINANLWTKPTVPPAAPTFATTCNMANGQRQASRDWVAANLLLDSLYFLYEVQLLFPKLTDVRGRNSVSGPSIVEAPAGSGVMWEVRWVYDAGKGFANEHRVAFAAQIPPYVDPLP